MSGRPSTVGLLNPDGTLTAEAAARGYRLLKDVPSFVARADASSSPQAYKWFALSRPEVSL